MTSPLVTALQAALAGEYAAAFGYGVVGAHTAGSARQRASVALAWHTTQQAQLTGWLTTAGATPVAAEPGYRLPAPITTPAGAVQLAATLEDRVAVLYADLIAVSSTAVRQGAAVALSACAVRSAIWRGRSEPFPGFAVAP